MRQHQVHAILPELGEHVRKTQRREVLELVEVDVKIAPLRFRSIGTAQASEPDGGNQKRAEQTRRSSPMRPLARLTSRIFPSSITLSQVEAALRLDENPSQHRIGKERPHLVLKIRRDRSSSRTVSG